MAAPAGVGASGPQGVLGGLLSGPGALIATAGLMVGVLGAGSLAAAGLLGPGGDGGAAPGSADRTLAVYSCYENGQLLGHMPPGQEVLVTALNADGTWLQIQFPGPTIQRAWVQAPPFTVDGNLSTLPRATCDEAPQVTPIPATLAPSTTPAPTATVEPEPSSEAFATAAPLPSATPSPSSGATSVPNSAPVIGALRENRPTIYADPGGFCPSNPKRVTISTTISDADGIATAQLWFRKPGASAFSSRPMSHASGSSTWTATLGTDIDGISIAGSIPYYVIAQDANASPASTRRPSPGTLSVAVSLCQNTGPTVTSLTSSQSTVYWVPGQAPAACVPRSPTTTTVTAVLSDTEGIASATLWYTAPGGSSYKSKAMSARGSSWVATLSTAKEIQAKGTVKYYVIGTDKKGKAGSAKPVKSFSSARCDTEATSTYLYPAASSTLCRGQTPAAYFSAYLIDGDGLLPTSARLYYRLPATSTFRSVGMWQSDTSGQMHAYTLQTPLSTKNWKAGTLRWYVISTDQFGGTTKFPTSGTFTITVPAGC